MQNPSTSPNRASSAEVVLGHHSRWMRLGQPLVITNAGLFLTLFLLWMFHPSEQRIEKWGHLPWWWGVGIAVPALFAVALWVIRRRSAEHAARSLDARLVAMNRLETAATLHDANDALARAQREETARFLSSAPVPSRSGLTRLLAIALGVAFLAHLITLGLWSRPEAHAVTPVPVKKNQPPPVVPMASITWKSPITEIKAAPIEEVPLQALADSVTGLKDLTLEIAVNGEPTMTVPVPVDLLGKPGKHSVQTSMYLDQLSVEPYDVVSYYLHVKRVSTEKLPEAVSAVQFVEVKPFRDDVRELPGGSGKSLFPLITALKVAQLRLLKENFVLAHAEISNLNPAWVKENVRVGSEQAVLEKKSGEVVEKLTAGGIPVEIVDLLNQARTRMTDAAKKIDAKQNEPAIPAQGKSLGLITEIEKYFRKVIAKDGSGKSGPTVKDPFQKQQELELKQRYQTLAGELELLVREQQRLAEDLNKEQKPADQQKSTDQGKSADQEKPQPAASPGTTPGKEDKNRIDGTLSERQTQISQRVGALLTGQQFVPEVNEHLENGRSQARESLRQLDADDIPKAREPAVSAARELRLAKEAMDRAGDDKAKDDLADALRAMNKAASQAAGAPKEKSDQAAQDAAKGAADKVEQARANLADAAKKQQETGSEKEAQRLAQAASELNSPGLRNDSQKLFNQPRDAAQAQTVSEALSRLADRIGGQQAGDKKTPGEIAALIERIERTRANMGRLAALEKSTAGKDGGNTPGQNGKQTDQPGKEPGSQEAKGQGKDGPGKEQQGQKGEGQQQGQAKQDQSGQGKDSSGKEQGEGQGQKGKEGKQPGQTKEDQKGQGQGAGETTQPGEQSGSASGKKPDQNQGSPGSQPGEDTSTTGGGTATHSDDTAKRESFAGEVLEDLRQEIWESAAVVPPGNGVEGMRQVLSGQSSGTGGNFSQCVAAFEEIQPPLDNVITLLKAELQKSLRQHELIDQSAEKALPAYREAVADYFEQLSRDYKTSPAGTPPDVKKDDAQ